MWIKHQTQCEPDCVGFMRHSAAELDLLEMPGNWTLDDDPRHEILRMDEIAPYELRQLDELLQMKYKVENNIAVPAKHRTETNPRTMDLKVAMDGLEIGQSIFVPYFPDEQNHTLASRIGYIKRHLSAKLFVTRKYPFMPPGRPAGIRIWRLAA